MPKVIPILWLLHPLGKVERLGQLRPKGDNCEGHCGSCVSCGVYRWASLLPLPCPVSFLSPPLGMAPVTLCGKHSVPKLFSESASWEAHPVPAPTSPVFQRLAEQPVPEGLFSELHNHTTFGLSGIWVRRHLEPPLGSFRIHSPRGQGMAGSGVKPKFLGTFSLTVVAVTSWLPAHREAFSSTGTNLVRKLNRTDSTWSRTFQVLPVPKRKGAYWASVKVSE